MDSFHALWIGNLDLSTTKEDLKEKFSPFGNIISLTVPTKGVDGPIRGFATCVYEDPACYEKAIHELDGKILKGKQIQVRYYDHSKRSVKYYEPAKRSSGNFPPNTESGQKNDRYYSDFSSKSNYQHESDFEEEILQPRDRESDFNTQMDNIMHIIERSEKRISVQQLNYLIAWAKISKSKLRPSYKRSTWKEYDDYSDDYPDKKKYFHGVY